MSRRIPRNSTCGLESLVTQLTPAEERRIRAEQLQQEAVIAQKVRRASGIAHPLPPSGSESKVLPPIGKGPATVVNNNRIPHLTIPPGSFTTNCGAVGSVVPAGYLEAHGMLVCQEALKTVQAKKKNQSPFASEKYFAMLPEAVPAKKDKILLCIDIDETMLHSTLVLPNAPPTGEVFDATIPIESPDGSKAHVSIHIRPHLQRFLEHVAPLFDIAVFTASQSAYAKLVLDVVDPQQKLMGSQRLFREHCAEVNGSRVKDLSLLGRPLDRVVLLDNSPVTYLFQPRNAIPITSYFQGKDDNELLKLIPMLTKLAAANSVYDVLDYYNAFLISPKVEDLMTIASPTSSSSPTSFSNSISCHTPLNTGSRAGAQRDSLASLTNGKNGLPTVFPSFSTLTPSTTPNSTPPSTGSVNGVSLTSTKGLNRSSIIRSDSPATPDGRPRLSAIQNSSFAYRNEKDKANESLDFSSSEAGLTARSNTSITVASC